MTRWFSSDLHLGDVGSARRRYCGDDVAKHDAWLAKRWDATIAAGDEVWLLGDVVCGMSIAEFAPWLHARPGRKHLVLGNWDLETCAVDNAWLMSGFETVQQMRLLRLTDGTVARLVHVPDDLLPSTLLLHGHTHAKAKLTRPGVVHVGWDAWRRFVPEADLIAVAAAGVTS